VAVWKTVGDPDERTGNDDVRCVDETSGRERAEPSRETDEELRGCVENDVSENSVPSERKRT
jgi:hypothetical protein